MLTSKGKVLTIVLTVFAAIPVLAQGPALTLSFTDLAPLDPASSVYEGWVIIDGAPVSTGVFNVDMAGEPVDPVSGDPLEQFTADGDLGEATDVKITIEPVPDLDPGPSGLVILGGALDGNVAALATGLEAAVATTGCFILATPSDNEFDTTNDNMGIWWLQQPGPEPGLANLPTLGAGWTYEGWVVDVSGSSPVPYSTGTFDMAAQFDSDAAGPMGGGPPFPGQDFVAYQGGPVLDLASGDFAAVISIEPVPDDSPAPFQLKPLAGPIAAGAAEGCVENQVMATFPAGVAEVVGTVAVEARSLTGVKRVFR